MVLQRSRKIIFFNHVVGYFDILNKLKEKYKNISA